MKRNIISLLLLSAALLSASAADFITGGNGTSYTLESLSQISGSNVIRTGKAYAITGNVTIAEGDKFALGPNVLYVQLQNSAVLTLNGEADFSSDEAIRISFDDGKYSDDPENYQPGSSEILIDNGDQTTVFSNITFTYMALRAAGASSLHISNCSFGGYTGSNAAVVYMTNSTGDLTVEDSYFLENDRSAIGNSYGCQNEVLIDNCVLADNALANTNTPQINLCASPKSITVSNCQIDGDTSLTMVGGIGVANWTGQAGPKVFFENNTITNCRYGLTTMGPTEVVITGNTISNNRYETNPNNGGSGISIYDPYYKTKARIYQNTIENNLWGITVIGGGDVNLGCVEKNGVEVKLTDADYCPGNNTFRGNGNGGQLYDLYNNGTNNIYAQNNTWGSATQSAEDVEGVIFHKNDQSSLGEVFFTTTQQTGISAPFANGKPASRQYFSLDGRRMSRSNAANSSTLYIIKERGRSWKVLR